MKLLRENIRQILFEKKIAKAMNKERFAKVLKSRAELISAKDFGEVSVSSNNKNIVFMTLLLSPYEQLKEDPADLSLGNVFGFMKKQREYGRKMSKEIDIQKWLRSLDGKYRNAFNQIANNRGWNVLKVTFEPIPGGTHQVSIQYILDMLASKENTNYFGQSDKLHADGYRCFHLTKSKNVSRIMSSGIKPTNVSSDMVMFGSGRSYYILTKSKNDEAIRQFFTEMMEEEGFAGIRKEKQTVIEINLDNELSIKFYIDTEFGLGSGLIRTRHLNPHAVWSPSHIPEELLSVYMEEEDE